MESTQTTKKARDLEANDIFVRWQRHYTIIRNEKGTGARGRSLLVTAQSGERLEMPIAATANVEIVND